MSQDKIRFLSQIVYTQFGSAVGEIATLLLERGSLPFPQLLRLSALPPHLVYSSLLILSLHSLLYHAQIDSSEGGNPGELYEINELAIEERTRIASFAIMACETSASRPFDYVKHLPGMEMEDALLKEEREGEGFELREVLKGLWRDGMKRAEAIEEEVKMALLERSKGWMDENKAMEKASKVVQMALNDGYISVVTVASQVSPSFTEIKWEEDLKVRLKGVPSAKDTKDIKTTIAAKWAEHRENERRKARGLPDPIDNDHGPKSKKRRKNEAFMVEEEDLGPKLVPLPNGAFYRVNNEQFHIRWRSQIMREFAVFRFGPLVGYVFGIILDVAESKVVSLEDPESTRVSIREITGRINLDPSAPDLGETFPPPSAAFPQLENYLPATEDRTELVFEICALLSDSGDNAHSLIDPRRGQQKNFLNAYSTQSHGGARWSVAFEELGARVKRALVEAMIEEKLDDVAVRCWRILDAKGKLDEKHLARIAFLSVKDAREAIARLSSFFLIEPQEVPRTADRAPSRTFFLWYVDYDKVVQNLLDHQYKALANILAQKEHQLGLKKGLVTKRERLDVRENPEQYLTKADQVAIRNLDSILEALTVAEMRISRDVFVLKELDPGA